MGYRSYSKKNVFPVFLIPSAPIGGMIFGILLFITAISVDIHIPPDFTNPPLLHIETKNDPLNDLDEKEKNPGEGQTSLVQDKKARPMTLYLFRGRCIHVSGENRNLIKRGDIKMQPGNSLLFKGGDISVIGVQGATIYAMDGTTLTARKRQDNKIFLNLERGAVLVECFSKEFSVQLRADFADNYLKVLGKRDRFILSTKKKKSRLYSLKGKVKVFLETRIVRLKSGEWLSESTGGEKKKDRGTSR